MSALHSYLLEVAFGYKYGQTLIDFRIQKKVTARRAVYHHNRCQVEVQ